MLNKKGFTLVEMMIVIAILAVISLLLVPNVISLMNKNKEKNCNSLKDNIISSAKMYVSENRYNEVITNQIDCGEGISTSSFSIIISSLVGYGNLSGTVINPVNKKDLKNKNVVVTYDCLKKEFNYTINEDNDTICRK